ncbi:MAG: hypothetical protein QNJ51_07175 [Calothrix sp. MO_167.B12]|nr:hypothetical protein [Calothrix sp. MO_167.B12]
MKSKLLSLGLFSISAISPFLIPALTPSAMAGCVAVDTNVQVAVTEKKRAQQSNNVQQEFGPNCENSVGSSVRSSSSQVCRSANCRQKRTSDQYVDGGRRVPVKTRNIPVKVDVRVNPVVPSTSRRTRTR